MYAYFLLLAFVISRLFMSLIAWMHSMDYCGFCWIGGLMAYQYVPKSPGIELQTRGQIGGVAVDKRQDFWFAISNANSHLPSREVVESNLASRTAACNFKFLFFPPSQSVASYFAAQGPPGLRRARPAGSKRRGTRRTNQKQCEVRVHRGRSW